jgi:hypothetical protein
MRDPIAQAALQILEMEGLIAGFTIRRELPVKPKFKGIAQSGQFVPERPELMEQYLLGMEGKPLDMVIGKPEEFKTNSQLAYFHGVVCRIASEASGYTKEEVKGLLKGMFLTRTLESKKTGKVIKYVPTLADLKKLEMMEFIDSCIMLIAREWSAVVPAPEEVVI